MIRIKHTFLLLMVLASNMMLGVNLTREELQQKTFPELLSVLKEKNAKYENARDNWFGKVEQANSVLKRMVESPKTWKISYVGAGILPCSGHEINAGTLLGTQRTIKTLGILSREAQEAGKEVREAADERQFVLDYMKNTEELSSINLSKIDEVSDSQ